MSDSVQRYQAAYSALENANKKASEIAAKLSAVERNVRNWDRIRITGATLRDELTIDTSLPLISESDWPTFESFRNAVSEYHKSFRAAQNIWINMSGQERVGLNPPPGR